MKIIQKRKIKTHQAQMTCDVEHTMVKSKALSNPSNPGRCKYLGVAQALKTNLALKKHTRVS